MKKHLKKGNFLIIFSVILISANESFALDSASVQPMGIKYAIFKFLIAMLGVLISILAIWAGLKIYKKFVLKDNPKSDNIEYNKTLFSPKDFKEAINLFLDKTDKK